MIERNKKLILKENEKDLRNAYKKKLKDNLIKRLVLDNKKILNIIKSEGFAGITFFKKK